MQDNLPVCVIAAADISCLEEEAVFLQAYHSVSDERRSKVDRLKVPADKRRSLGAGILLNAVLAQFHSDTVTGRTGVLKKNILKVDLINALEQYDAGLDYETAQMPQGKPYFVLHPQLHFNLSHSGRYAVCVLSDTPVGIDIEGSRTFRNALAKRFFSEAECGWIKQAAEKQAQECRFFRLWTLKEAYGKATGRGLADSIAEAFFVPQNDSDALIFADDKLSAEYGMIELAQAEYRIAVVYQRKG